MDDKGQIINILSKWINIKSIYDKNYVNKLNPFGKNVSDALQFFCNIGIEAGFTTKNMQNKVAYIQYGNEHNTDTKYIDIFGHCDVVDVDIAKWSYEPFNLTIQDDKLIGRGVSDNKGPIVACFLALKKIKDENIKLNRTIRLIVGGNEESGFDCIRHYYKNEPKGIFGFTPDAKFPILNGEKGACIIDIFLNINNKDIYINTKNAHNVIPSNVNIINGNNKNIIIEGIGGHSSKPQNSKNPIPKSIKYIYNITNEKNILELYKIICDENQDGKLFGLNIKGKCGVISIVPTILSIENGVVRITLDIRFPEILSFENICNKVQLYIDKNALCLSKKSKYIKSPNYIDENSIFVKTLHNIYIKHTGDTHSKIRTTSAGTYASEMNNAVIFGCEFPDGSSGNVHMEDEFTSLENLRKAIYIYKEAFIELCNIL